MSPLTEDRLVVEISGDLRVFAVAAAKELFAGALICLNAAGDATPGEAALGLTAVGRCEGYVDNRNGQAGDQQVTVKAGVFRYDNSAAADAITVADVSKPCYIVDDHTVAKTSGAGTRSVAGRIHSVEDAGVFVAIGAVARLAPIDTAAFVVGAEAANVVNVGIQLKDPSGANLAVRGSVLAYLATEIHGDVVAAAAPSGGVAIGADGLAISVVAGKAFQLVSEANGHIDLNITEAGAATWYLAVVLPDGRLAVSGAITFAA